MNAHSLRSILRRRNAAALTVFFLFSVVAVCGFVAGGAQSDEKEEREVVDKIPKHLPIKVKIKKPEKLKDAKNEDWPDDMEIEVTNTGTKPIYYLHVRLDMPDVLSEKGIMYGFFYRFGRIDLVALDQPVLPDDVPLRPGETVTLTDTDKFIKGWKSLRAKGKITNPKKLEFAFGVINFGDGTGYAGMQGTPMPIKRKRSSNAPRGGAGGSTSQNAGLADLPLRAFMDSACNSNPTKPPVSFLPAAFARAEPAVEPAAP